MVLIVCGAAGTQRGQRGGRVYIATSRLTTVMVEPKAKQQDTVFVPGQCVPYTILGEQLDARNLCLLHLTAAHPKKS